MNKISKLTADFFSLFFPDTCCSCGRSLAGNEHVVCTACLYELPYTDFHLQPDNPVARQFWGRVPLVSAGAFLYFQKHSRVQNIIHQLKYNHRPEVGVWLGKMYGRQLKKKTDEDPFNFVIPVPLHKSREKTRGYNQSECIAAGLSAILHIPVETTILRRNVATQTQTHKSRISRFENMKNAFSLNDPGRLIGTHILLVDDVITTGATLEACALQLLSVPAVRVSVAAAAFAI